METTVETENTEDDSAFTLPPSTGTAEHAEGSEAPPQTGRTQSNPTFKDVVEELGFKQKLALKLVALQDAAAMFVGATVAPHLPKIALILGVIAIGIAVPVATEGLMPKALFCVIPVTAMALLVGIVSSQSRLSHIGMALGVVGVVVTIGASIYFHHDLAVDRVEQQV